MKTVLFWLPKGCRKPKMQGLATAVCSAATIQVFRRMALDGKGKFFIVDCETAAQGRDIIKSRKAGMVANLDDGNTIVLGVTAVLAINGANESCANWDSRIAQNGKVSERESRALRGDDSDMGRLDVNTLFREVQ